MEKRIEDIFKIKFLRVGVCAALGMMLIFIALFSLEVRSQGRIHIENSRREAENLQDSLISQLSNLIEGLNFYHESEGIIAVYDGDLEARKHVYENFRGWMDRDDLLTAIILYDKDGKKVMGYSKEKRREKIADFVKLKDEMLKEVKRDEYHIVNKLNKKKDNTYFFHFVPVYEGDELKGYLTAVGHLKKLMIQYEKLYRNGDSRNTMGFLRLAEGNRVEGVMLNGETMKIELFISGYRKKTGYIVTECGDYIVLSDNLKDMLQKTEGLKDYIVKYDDGNSVSTAAIRIKKEAIVKATREVARRYLGFYLLTTLITLAVLYRYLRLAFENDLGKRRLRVKARKLDKNISAINTVVSVVGHDIKGPFTSLLGGFALIKKRRGSLDEGQLAMYLNLMEEECRKACHFSENLMKWAISQDGLYSYNPKEVELFKTVQKQVEEYRGMALLKEVDVEVDIPEGLTCYSDKDILKTVTRNLLINAIKFTSAKGSVGIKARVGNGMIELLVEDTGMGMPEDVLKMIEKGAVYTSKGSTGEVGSGMGLILIKRLCKINMGNLHIESESGRGTRVIVTIPERKGFPR